MSKSNDGGTVHGTTDWTVSEGMSLRDYFAGQALQGAVAHPDQCGVIDAEDRAYLARWSYKVADEMLKAREKNDE